MSHLQSQVREDGNPTPIVLNLAVAGDPTTATLGVEKREQIISTLPLILALVGNARVFI